MGTYKEADNNARNSYSPDYGYYEGEPRRSSVPEIPALPMDLELYSAVRICFYQRSKGIGQCR